MEKKWTLVTSLWVGLIFFSSTSMAARSCESFYEFVRTHLLPVWNSPGGDDRLLHLIAEKGVHFTLFCVFGYFMMHILRGDALQRVAKVAAFGFLVGSCSEFLQSLFPGRDPAARDVIINLTSAVIGGLLTLLWWRRKEAIP
jgi:VanZ family protein